MVLQIMEVVVPRIDWTNILFRILEVWSSNLDPETIQYVFICSPIRVSTAPQEFLSPEWV
jgi:hypothetical protein